MFNESDPIVRFKLDLLSATMPAESAVVFGDMYIVEGGYTARCIEYGCERALLIDTLETPGWLNTRARYPQIDFFKGDFSNPLFMASVRERFSVGVAFDILLHQAPLVSTLHLLLEKIEHKIIIAQPVLKERPTANSLIYLPGQPTDSNLYPLASHSEEYRAFDIREVNQSHWIWGMTPSVIRSLLIGEGFDVIDEIDGADLENGEWNWWGCIAERASKNIHHWGHASAPHGLFESDW